MIASVTTRVALVFVALLVAGVAYTQVPAEKTEASITFGFYQNFAYSPATGLGTWTFRLSGNDPFVTNLTFIIIGPAGSIVTSATPANCVGLPRGEPLSCTMPVTPTTLDLTITAPFPQQCAAQNVLIGGFAITQSSAFAPNFTLVVPATSQSSVGGVLVNNVVPANLALCPTPIPNTPTPTPTATPIVLIPAAIPVIPQVFQQPVGGIFNGPRSNTPTPVRPREVGTAGSAGVGLPPAGAMPMLRPPSTGDAGILPLRKPKLGAW